MVKKFLIFIPIMSLLFGCASYNNKANEDLHKICIYKKDAKACGVVSARYIEKDNYKEAVAYLKYACNIGDSTSCVSVGRIKRSYLEVQDYNEALIYYDKACSLDNSYGCYNAGLMYYNGEGVEKDYDKAKKYLSIACEKDDGYGCYYLGVIENYTDNRKAFELYKKACTLKSRLGCDKVEKYYHYPIDEDMYKEALEYFKKICESGEALYCSKVYYIYKTGKGYIGKDQEQADKYYEKTASLYNKTCKKVGKKDGCYEFLYDSNEMLGMTLRGW